MTCVGKLNFFGRDRQIAPRQKTYSDPRCMTFCSMNFSYFNWILLITIFTCFVFTPVQSHPNLKLVHNGYEGLLVGISPDISQDHCNSIIHGLKVVLSKFSSLLWEFTKGRASLREVTISLPRHWRTNDVTCSFLEPVESSSPPVDPHISLTKPHPLYGMLPWTQQSQGCGRPGDFIGMGADIFRTVSNDSHSKTAQKLLGEWVKFRWGVFDENGHEGDPLYPPYYRDPLLKDLRPNKCFNVQENSLPFCDIDNHVPEAPTKHNALCVGRPVWDIIEQSEDFKDDRNLASNMSVMHEPIYRYIQESSPRFVLAVEDTAVMNMQRRWEFVRKAVRRSLVYDIPDDTYMSLVVFNSVAHTVAPLSKIDSVSDVRQRIGSSLPRNPSTVPESHKCVLCGLQEALRSLNADPAGASGANIILLTTGAGAATQHQMDEMVRMVKNSGVRIIPIIYPLTEKPGTTSSSATDNLQPLIEANDDGNRRMFTVIDEGVGNDSKVSMMVALMNALLASFRIFDHANINRTPLLVHSEGYPGGISSLSSGSFSLDDSLGQSARFSVYYYDLNHVGNTIQLTTPSGNVMASVNMQEEDGDANVIFVNIPKAERGVWHYKVENRADSHQGLHIEVTAYENANREIALKLWTNVEGGPINIPYDSSPIILYAEVTDGNLPVIDAEVRVKLQRLGRNATRYPYEPYYVDLLDNGAGDPDITKGDGVYSRYLPQVNAVPGHYELSVSAHSTNKNAKVPSTDSLFKKSRRMFGEMSSSVCCGNHLHYDNLKVIDPFFREVTYGVLNIASISTIKDVTPPSRILDLRADVDKLSNEVTLRWTAPGDDFDWGSAHQYEAVVASSWSEAKAFDGERITNLPVPLKAAFEQSTSMSFDRYDQISYISIRGVDSAGNKGGVSNIASIWIPLPPTTQPPATTPSSLSPSVSSKPQENSLTQHIRVAGLTLEDAAIVAGAGGGFLIILTVFSTFCYMHIIRKRREQRKKDNEKLESNRNVMIKSNSAMMLAPDDSRDSADSTVKDGEALKDGRSLSPVQSWAASKLLAEHERRFSVSCAALPEHHGSIVHYGASLHDTFPDVTITGAPSYASSQATTTTHSDPPAYHPSCITDGYAYNYPFNPSSFHPEDLPPYTAGISSQSSQGSSAYTQETSQLSESMYPTDNAYQQEMPAFISDPASYANIPSYCHSKETPLRPPLTARKVPPPVAPKPQMMNHSQSNASPTNSTSSEPKRRNVTQV